MHSPGGMARYVDTEKLKEIFGEPDVPGEMLKVPHDDQFCCPRVECKGFVDVVSGSECLSFGAVHWGGVPRIPGMLFYADGYSCMAIDHKLDNPRFRVANRLNKRIKKKHIQSIFVVRKEPDGKATA